MNMCAGPTPQGWGHERTRLVARIGQKLAALSGTAEEIEARLPDPAGRAAVAADLARLRDTLDDLARVLGAYARCSPYEAPDLARLAAAARSLEIVALVRNGAERPAAGHEPVAPPFKAIL